MAMDFSPAKDDDEFERYLDEGRPMSREMTQAEANEVYSTLK